MNEELIRKLHDQAWGETHEKAIAVTETPIDFQKVLRERFAELIVRECMRMCEVTEMSFVTHDCDVEASGAITVKHFIAEHFGVE